MSEKIGRCIGMQCYYAIPPEIADTWDVRLKHAGYEVHIEALSRDEAQVNVLSKGNVKRGRQMVGITILAPIPNPRHWNKIGRMDIFAGKYMVGIHNRNVGRWPWNLIGMSLFRELARQFEVWALPLEPDPRGPGPWNGDA